jgi:hypothetical protein
VEEDYLLAAMAIALDVQRAGSGGDPKDVRFDGEASVGGEGVQFRAGMLVN